MFFQLLDTNQYVYNEMNAVEREQNQIDERAAEVEWKLREVMDKGQLTLWIHPSICDFIGLY